MALTNCTLSSTTATFTKIGGSALGSTTAVLTISPNTGYVVSASAFTNNTGGLPEVAAITLSDSLAPGILNNTVLVTILLNPGFIMPSANHLVTVDIDGEATKTAYTIAGTYDIIHGGNATPVQSFGNVYSENGNWNQQQTLFTKTIAAAGGYHFFDTPYHILVTGDNNNYDITTGSLVYNSSGDLTSITFTVKYTYPSANVSGDKIEFHARALETPVTVPDTIYKRVIDTKSMSDAFSVRTYYIWGDPGAPWQLDVYKDVHEALYGTSIFKKSDDTAATKVLSTSGTLDSSGTTYVDIEFPKLIRSSTDVVHSLTLSGTLLSSLKTHLNTKVDTITQHGNVTATFTTLHPTLTSVYGESPLTAWNGAATPGAWNSYSGASDANPLTGSYDTINTQGVSFTQVWRFEGKNSAYDVWFVRWPVDSDIVNTGDSDWSIKFDDYAIAPDNTTDGGDFTYLTITGKIFKYGIADISPTLHVDNVLVAAPDSSPDSAAEVWLAYTGNTLTEYTVAKTGYETAIEAINKTVTFSASNTDTAYTTTNRDFLIWKLWTLVSGTNYNQFAPTGTSGYYYKIKQGAWNSTYPEFIAKITTNDKIEDHQSI